mgnify:CR=1 FL=1
MNTVNDYIPIPLARLLTGNKSLMDIYVHPQIDCPEYRKILETFHRLRPEGRPSVIALDLPKSMYKQTISRDEWMAQTIAARVNRNPVTKMLVIVGNFHVLKKLVWPTSLCKYAKASSRTNRQP